MTTRSTGSQDDLHRRVNAKALELKDVPPQERQSAAEKNGLLTDSWQWVLRAVKALVDSSEIDIQDVAQTVVMKSSVGLARFKYDSQFTTWLFRIAIHTVSDFRKKTRDNVVSLEELVERGFRNGRWKREPVAPTLDVVANLSAAQEIKEVLQKISPEDGKVLEMRLLGFSTDAIAQSLMITAAAVRQRSSRALRRLIKLQQEESHDQPARLARKPHQSRTKRGCATGS